MLYAVLADIHGNLQALSAVLDDVEDAGADGILCLGDIVGYGANPVECVEVVRECGAVSVAGNHDWGVLNKIDTSYFNADARDSIEWTQRSLSDGSLDYLAGLELVITLDDISLVHSSLFAPDCFDYIQNLYDVQLAFSHMEGRVCFVGHSHVPVMFTDTAPIDCFLRDEYQVPPDRRAVINVGSVGQPRDLDPRASYGLYDSGERKVYMRRVEYDVHRAAQLMVEAGLPSTNAARISLGR